MPQDGELVTRAAFPPDGALSDADLAAARWSWDADRPAGRGTDTLPGGRWLFVPIRTSRSAIAVMGVLPQKEGYQLSAGERRLLEAVGNQAAVAIERVTLAEDIDQARLGAERERLRSSMLTSVSHDLRTPLASIIGALSSLRSFGERYDAAAREELLATAQGEAERLDRFVGNLLDMTRLDAGAIVPKREAVEVGDLDIDGAAPRRAAVGRARGLQQRSASTASLVARFRAGRAGTVQPARQCRQVFPAGRPPLGRGAASPDRGSR